jgi:hypothetical protein
MNRTLLVLLSILIVVGGVIGGAAYYRYHHPLVAASKPTTTTAPVTHPATVAAIEKPKPHPTTQLLDILRAGNPDYPTTQRLDTSLDLKYAARILLSDPLYLDNQANLWITRPDAPADFDFAKAAASDTATHIVRDTVVFVLWDTNDNGKWVPHLVVKNPQGKGYELLDADGRRPLADPFGFDFSRALILAAPPGEAAQIVVPTATGVCAFPFSEDPQTILKNHRQLIDPRDKRASDRAVRLVMDTQGVIAYVTNAAGTHGESGLARFAPKPPANANAKREYAWAPLPGWADKIVYLVPLLDGSVLQISSVDGEEKDKVAFALNTLAKVTIDQKRVLQLIEHLSDPDAEQRDKAFKTLTTFGPGIAPIMEKVLDEQSIEAQIRIRQLLKNKITPSLGSMSLVDGCMRVVNRLPDGGIIFYSEAGVAIPRPDDTPAYVTPAWLSLRPGRAVELLPASLVADLQPGKQTIIPWSLNDYIVLDPVQGPEWYIGNRLQPLLRKEHRHFNHFTGIDSTGRWIFQTKIVAKVTSATHPTAAQDSALRTQDSTLIIDPHLPDPTPRLPGWLLPASIGKVGWDKNNWPVIYMDAQPNPVPWALGESEWRVIDEKKESVLTTSPVITAPPRPATTRAATTTTTTSPTSQTSALSPQDFLLSTPDGAQYYDGRQTLTVIHLDGSRLTWPLPQQAVGTAKPTLLRTRDGHLFLFNEPGRVVRIRPTPDSIEPFKIEAVFTRGVPSDPKPLRIWLDPADRICIAHDQNRITVLFPTGRISPAIAQMMRPEDFPPDEP